ncbi:CLC4M protein, partial [Atractosteus spatula]|nr:CLC4M protein [Atractosteus spatula]
FHLRNITRLCPTLLLTVAEKLINTFVFSRTDYGNALLAGMYLSSKISSNHRLGLSDSGSEGSWKWVDGTPVDMSDKYWNAGEPNNVVNEDCGELKKSKLNDTPCSINNPWICEKTA